ncbi:MAG TPA: TRAM domain-containing protein [Vicinamibacterales bacterium]|nr:TRAM domain-containing protein [Vicinamibacterales bacterium]
MALIPGSEVVLTPEKPVAGGRMLARHEGQVVLVAGAIPGERVRARIDQVRRQLAFAVTVQVLDPSSDRRASTLDWACGGSLYAHIAYARQLSLKSELVADGLTRIGKIAVAGKVQVMASPEDGYRMRARLHIRNARIGFFREGTHELCDVAPTRQLLPATVDALKAVEQALGGRADDAVSCEVSENIPGLDRAILIEFADGRAELAPGCESAYVTDAIDVDGGCVRLTRHVRSFFQANRWLVAQLAARVVSQVTDGPVADLYAGVGLFAVSLAARGRTSVVAVEGERFAASDLENNAAACGNAIAVTQTSVERYLSGPASRVLHTIVLDPPRTGISSEAMSGLVALKAPRVVYVSCDVATLARDLKRFAEAGYRLDHLEAFDLFPNTAHVETLAVLAR